MEYSACGTTVHYERSGSGESRVLLLHGWGCDVSLMKPVADALSDEAQTLTIDFPGHGASGRPPEPWGVPEYAACLAELLEHEHFIPCTVIAHSFGGRVAIWLAANRPELVSRMVLTGAAGLKKPQTEEARKRSEQYHRLKGLCEGMKKLPGLGKAADSLEEKLRQRYGSADYNALDAEMRKTFVKVISLDLADCLPRIQCPVLLLWGDKDTETPIWMGEKMEKDIPDAGLVRMAGGTHFAYLEQLPYFVTVVRNFLHS